MRNTGETKVHKTLTMPISFYALVEQIRSKQGLDTAEDAIKVSVMQLARKIGLEAWVNDLNQNVEKALRVLVSCIPFS